METAKIEHHDTAGHFGSALWVYRKSTDDSLAVHNLRTCTESLSAAREYAFLVASRVEAANAIHAFRTANYNLYKAAGRARKLATAAARTNSAQVTGRAVKAVASGVATLDASLYYFSKRARDIILLQQVQ